MSANIIDKVYIGLDNAPAAFDIKNRILGPNGTNLEYIRSETGVVAVLKGDKFEPLHLALHHTRSDAISSAKALALNLIETIRAELAQWSAAQAGGPPPMNVPPPTLTTSAPLAVPPPSSSTTSLTTATAVSSATQQASSVMSPVVSVSQASTPLMTVRQPTVLQLLPPQQQYVLNQENGQLIPIVQPGVQVPTSNFTSLPIAQSLTALQQPNFGTQIVDISGMQPMNVTQFRLSGVPSSMSTMILPNGITIPSGSITGATDTTTVSSAISAPVVCAAQSTNSAQKILYTDKVDKSDIKYIQGADTLQWTMPGSQTMLIPYQQLQELTGNPAGLTSIHPQQFVSIAPAGGLPQTSLPLTQAQLQQLQATGTIMPFNQKSNASTAPLINIISTGQASSPQITPGSTPTKGSGLGNHESRGQKRSSDGTPTTQLQLRPIAPAGSVQDKNSSRESRPNVWPGAGRENAVSMGMRINPAHGTIIHVSSGQQTSGSTSGVVSQDGQGVQMHACIRQIDRNSLQLLQGGKDAQKHEISMGKIHPGAQNVQMITVPPGMTVLQNPLSIGQMPTLVGQPNSQVYMIPANQSNLVQAGALAPGILGQQVLQPGQNVTVMQPNQLSVPNGMQYNTVPIMPMNMAPNAQYMPAGINLSSPLSAQQLNAALASQQLSNPNLAGTMPIVQANPPGSPLTNLPQTLSASQAPVHQMIPQNASYVTPNLSLQSQAIHQQYVIQPNSNTIPLQPSAGIQYNIQSNPSSTPPSSMGNIATNQTSTTTESDTNSSNSPNSNTISSQNTYIPPAQATVYPMTSTQGVQSQQSYNSEAATTQNSSGYSTPNQNANSQQFNTSNTNYSQSSSPQPTGNYTTNGSQPNPQSGNQNNYPANSGTTVQNISQDNYTAAPATQCNPSNGSYTPNQQTNPYPNATGQNMAAYANNQYPYNNRPWFRAPRFQSPQGAVSYGAAGIPPPSGPTMTTPPPNGNYNYWQDS